MYCFCMLQLAVDVARASDHDTSVLWIVSFLQIQMLVVIFVYCILHRFIAVAFMLLRPSKKKGTVAITII